MPTLQLTVALFFTGCLLGGTGNKTPPAEGEVLSVEDYRTEGTKLVETSPATTIRYCDGDTLVSFPLESITDTLEYSIIDSHLTLTSAPYPSDGGVILKRIERLKRVGSANGLEGDWELVSYGREVVSGILTDEEKTRFDGYDSMFAYNRKYSSIYYRFEGGKKTELIDSDDARQFVDSWYGDASRDPESTIVAITVQALDKHTVELKGLKTGETVRITLESLGDRTYMSDNPQHATFHLTIVPESCPEKEYGPDWYFDFIEANFTGGISQKPPAKLTATPKWAQKRGFPMTMPASL